jgi:Tfp pilus assembly protein PilF
MAERGDRKDKAMTERDQDQRRLAIKYRALENTRRWLRLHYPDLVLVVVLLVLASYSCWPDAILAGNQYGDSRDYTYPVLHLLQGKGLVDIFNGSKYPPVHNFGAMLMMVPAYLVFGTGNPGNAVYAVTAMALACVCLLYYIAMKLFDDRAVASVACLLLIAAEQFRWLAISIMSDIPALFIWLLTIAVLLRGRRLAVNGARHERNWLLLGLLAGFGACIHPINGLLLIPLAWFITRPHHEWFAWEKRQLVVNGTRHERVLRNGLMLAAGVAVWGGVYLCVNYAYTGDCLRFERQVRQSVFFEKGSKALSASNMFTAPKVDLDEMRFGGEGGSLDRIFSQGLFQWSLMDNNAPAKRGIYYALDLFALIGLAVAGHRVTISRKTGDFAVLLVLTVIPLILFFCRFEQFAIRFFLRVVPLICLLTALGVVAVCRTKLAIPTSIALLWAFVYLIRHPYDAVDRYFPVVSLAKSANEVIREDDAIVIGNMSASPIEEYVIKDTHRLYVPLNLSIISGQNNVQWHKPPHPEWIPQQVETGLYPRMFENGALLIYPYTAHNNPEQVDRWLHEGKAVYLVLLPVSTDEDAEIVRSLVGRYRVEILKGAVPPSKAPPATLSDQFPGYVNPSIMRIFLKPSNPESEHNNPGNAVMPAGRPEEAIGRLEQTLRAKPNDAKAHYNLGNVLLQARKPEEAIVHYEQALRIKPDYAEAHNNLGNALLQLGRPQEAIGHFEQALRIRPDFAEPHGNLGDVLVGLGKIQEAIGHYEQALRIRPDLAEAHNNLGNALLQLGRSREAIGHFEQALRIRPDYAEAHYNLVRARAVQ